MLFDYCRSEPPGEIYNYSQNFIFIFFGIISQQKKTPLVPPPSCYFFFKRKKSAKTTSVRYQSNSLVIENKIFLARHRDWPINTILS